MSDGSHAAFRFLARATADTDVITVAAVTTIAAITGRRRRRTAPCCVTSRRSDTVNPEVRVDPRDVVPPRPRRQDAARNYDALVAAARAEFEANGVDAS
ncbi:hypothetical protein GCM10010129_77900 [Streptomyces fumigatiscleroticus]|nr:hypothetical protein GCM10010129_77900 [Streptomyces fumigatiscleroticus]